MPDVVRIKDGVVKFVYANTTLEEVRRRYQDQNTELREMPCGSAFAGMVFQEDGSLVSIRPKYVFQPVKNELSRRLESVVSSASLRLVQTYLLVSLSKRLLDGVTPDSTASKCQHYLEIYYAWACQMRHCSEEIIQLEESNFTQDKFWIEPPAKLAEFFAAF